MQAHALTHLMTLVRLAWRNVKRNWRHSLATLLTIGSGFCAISLFDGFLNDLDFKTYDGYSHRGMLGQLVVFKSGALASESADSWAYQIDEKEQSFLEDFLKNDPAVKVRVRFLGLTGIYNHDKQSSYFYGYGFDVAEGLAMRGSRWAWNTLAGRPLAADEPPALEVGRGLATMLGCMPEGPLPLQKNGLYQAQERPLTCAQPRLSLTTTSESGQINLMDLPIRAVIDAGSLENDKRSLHMPLSTAQALLNTKKISQVSIEMDKAEVPAFEKRFEAAAKKAGFTFDLVPWYRHPLALNAEGGIQILGVFRNLFMIVVAAIGAMAIANSMMKSVSERTREIATLRSLGFHRRDIISLFAFEGLFTCLLACVAGLASTLVFAWLIGALGVTFDAGFLSLPVHLHVSESPITWLVSASLLSFLAMGTSFICVRRASAMRIADALRYV